VPSRLREASSPWLAPAALGVLLTTVGLAGLSATTTLMGLALEAMFILFFARHVSFALAAMRSAPIDFNAPVLDTGYRPMVSVLVACKDEERVVEGLVTSLLSLEYPAERLQLVVVNDGSSDRTGELLTALQREEPRLTCLHRGPTESAGKSAALNAALDVLTGEVTIVFDADHQPHADVARRLVRHFEDPSIAAVQGRCVVRNGDDSLLARLVAIDYQAGYLVNEYGRQAVFRLPAYGGANCAVRTSSLRGLGGWNHASVTEDTDLTLRLVLCGQRVRYDVTAIDEEEGVATLRRFWRQRYRWARGHQRACRDYRATVWRSPFLSGLEKVEATMFLFVFHLPVVSGLGLTLLVAWATGLAGASDPFHAFVLWTLLFIGPLFELSGGLLIARNDRRDALLLVFFLPLFFISILLCTKAWLDGLLERPYAWVKTERSGASSVSP
jgi:cellulose synthase/poly-beta-1,6-N-acetylglucosamine synthase-like glycosyltransferase